MSSWLVSVKGTTIRGKNKRGTLLTMMYGMAIRVVEFSKRGYKIRKVWKLLRPPLTQFSKFNNFL
jgi:hypothetical protein